MVADLKWFETRSPQATAAIVNYTMVTDTYGMFLCCCTLNLSTRYAWITEEMQRQRPGFGEPQELRPGEVWMLVAHGAPVSQEQAMELTASRVARELLSARRWIQVGAPGVMAPALRHPVQSDLQAALDAAAAASGSEAAASANVVELTQEAFQALGPASRHVPRNTRAIINGAQYAPEHYATTLRSMCCAAGPDQLDERTEFIPIICMWQVKEPFPVRGALGTVFKVQVCIRDFAQTARSLDMQQDPQHLNEMIEAHTLTAGLLEAAGKDATSQS